MAGIFGMFDYKRSGAGVEKDAPPKPRIKVFFEVLFRKITQLMGLNLLFFLFNIPALVISFFVSLLFIREVVQGNLAVDLTFRFILGASFMCIPLITVGPAQAGLTYVLRNYSREEHAWVWWDFKEYALKNMKQGFAVSVIDLLVTSFAGIVINYYLILNKDGNIFYTAATGFVVIAFILYIMMHMYIYPMMVTFKLTVKELYKNALLFAVVRFIPNLGILALCALIVILAFGLNPIVGIILYIIILISLIGLITNFYVYPVLKKYMLDEVPDNNSTEEEY